MTILVDELSALPLTREADEVFGVGRGAGAVDDRLLGADELSVGLALCRDWASKKRLVCSFAEQETRLLAGVESVDLAIFERQASLVTQGTITVDEAHVPGLVLTNFLNHVLPEAERYLGVQVTAVEIDVVVRLD